MTEESEPKKKLQTEPVEPQGEPNSPEKAPEKKPEDSPAEIAKTAAHLEVERLTQKVKEAEEVEKRMDEKIAGFKKFVDDTKAEGRAMAIPEKTDEEKAKEDAKALIAGTGLESKLD